jgi:hypothetical protein
MSIRAWMKSHPKYVTGLVLAVFGAAGSMLYEAKPAYDGYTERAELAKRMTEASEAKAAFSEYLLEHEKPPNSLQDLQLTSSHEFQNLDEVVVRQTGFDVRCNEKAQYTTARFRYEIDDGNLRWDCELPEGAVGWGCQ